jgi:hypothetical protein
MLKVLFTFTPGITSFNSLIHDEYKAFDSFGASAPIVNPVIVASCLNL